MRADLSDIQRTVDLNLAGLDLNDIETLDDVIKRGLTAIQLETSGMNLMGFKEKTVAEVRTLLADARKAIRQDAAAASGKAMRSVAGDYSDNPQT